MFSSYLHDVLKGTNLSSCVEFKLYARPVNNLQYINYAINELYIYLISVVIISSVQFYSFVIIFEQAMINGEKNYYGTEQLWVVKQNM